MNAAQDILTTMTIEQGNLLTVSLIALIITAARHLMKKSKP